jgi:hypothetical protein
MFFASFEKMFLLIGIIAAVWYGFRIFGAIERARARGQQAERQARARHAAQSANTGAASRGAANGRTTDARMANVEETIRCRTCGAFVPARQPSRCGRGDCPFPA